MPGENPVRRAKQAARSFERSYIWTSTLFAAASSAGEMAAFNPLYVSNLRSYCSNHMVCEQADRLINSHNAYLLQHLGLPIEVDSFYTYQHALTLSPEPLTVIDIISPLCQAD